MTFAKLHDTFHAHPKLTALEAGLAFAEALALWTVGISWCSAQLSDGVIPKLQLRKLVPYDWSAGSSELVRVGLWHDGGDTFVFHDWAEHQQSAHRVLKTKKNAAERQRVARDKKKASRVTSRDSHALRHGPVTLAIKEVREESKRESREDATPKTSPKPKPPTGHDLATGDERVTAILAEYRKLHGLGERWKDSTKEEHFTRAEHVHRALLGKGRDQMTQAEILAAIRGNHADPFCRRIGKHELEYILRPTKVNAFVTSGRTAAPAVDFSGIDADIKLAESLVRRTEDPPDGSYDVQAAESARMNLEALLRKRSGLARAGATP